MNKLRPTDGTVPHRRHARYHIDILQTGATTLHAQLAKEMTVLYVDLKAKARAHEDAEDDYLGASAQSDAAEIVVENAIRRIDTELVRADQADSTLNAQRTVFPQGFGPIIEPEGDVQRTTLPGVFVRAAPFANNNPYIADAVDALAVAQKDFEGKLALETAALAAEGARFAEEQEARRLVREQIDSAYGRLRDLYKGRVALAEPFFYKEKKRRKKASTESSSEPAKAPAPKAAGGNP